MEGRSRGAQEKLQEARARLERTIQAYRPKGTAVRKLAIPDLTTTVLTLTITGIGADCSVAKGNNPRLARRVASVAAMFFGCGVRCSRHTLLDLSLCGLRPQSPPCALQCCFGLCARPISADHKTRLCVFMPRGSFIAAGCGQPPTVDEVQPFISLCRPRCRSHRVWLPMFLELGVLGFGLSIDGNIGVGIFPNAKEFFVRFAGGCVVAHQSLCPTELKPGQWAGYKFPA